MLVFGKIDNVILCVLLRRMGIVASGIILGVMDGGTL